MCPGGRRVAAMQLDAGSDLVRIGRPVAHRGLDLGLREGRVLEEGGHWVWLRRQIIQPHRDLPDVRTADQPGATTGRTITERGVRMLLATRPLLGIATQAIRKGLPGSPRSQTQTPCEGIVKTN
jgi:hypothetical protein